jgi:predicted nucleotidyltransferase
MLIPTFDRMRELIAPAWQKEEYQQHILWAGIFGSVSRNRANVKSDVDILIVLKQGCSGEPVDLRESWLPVPLLFLLMSLSRAC